MLTRTVFLILAFTVLAMTMCMFHGLTSDAGHCN